MIDYECVQQSVALMKQHQNEANKAISAKRKVEGALRPLGELLAKYCADEFNNTHSESISDYTCLRVDNLDASINWDMDSVFIRSDNPRTYHPYDATDIDWKISELLVIKDIKEDIASLENPVT